MKSTQEQLLKRGQYTQETLKEFENYSKDELIKGFQLLPHQRSACIYLLSLKYHQDANYTQLLLQQLSKEKALYTRIEIQKHLSKYGNIQQMCQYLGKIGHNQYKKLPTKISMKKSYPLPRDIVARSLAHMNKDKLYELFSILPTLQEHQLIEAIDAFGFLCFYHQDMINDDMYLYLIHLYHNNENLLMKWKIITCLSAFPQSYPFLIQLKEKHSILLQEIERSLNIIESSYNQSMKYHV